MSLTSPLDRLSQQAAKHRSRVASTPRLNPPRIRNRVTPLPGSSSTSNAPVNPTAPPSNFIAFPSTFATTPPTFTAFLSTSTTTASRGSMATTSSESVIAPADVSTARSQRRDQENSEEAAMAGLQEEMRMLMVAQGSVRDVEGQGGIMDDTPPRAGKNRLDRYL
ncbi:hypothetical protein EJ08DRAFT_674294 [Tothia fuscella]|uniref:Uncharacterized protein n=1 Tax=Tothia fuscella TaxID=1048955 RepID=A0A9P4P3T2_9PEZI|nr:hypothetical protein EJ08DRAFT_674294 [Tothia fuscella]